MGPEGRSARAAGLRGRPVVPRGNPSPPSPQDGGDATTVEGALELVRLNGSRITSSRQFSIGVLFDNDGHHTSEELAAQVQVQAPDIHLSTIYRNLGELEKLGVRVHSHLGHGPATDHLASTTTDISLTKSVDKWLKLSTHCLRD